MTDSLYTAKLAWFKDNELTESILLVADDPDLIRVIIGWGHTRVKPRPELTELMDDSTLGAWEWLWANTEFSRDEFMAKAGLWPFEVDRALDLLIGNRLIYPDGTAHGAVRECIARKVGKLADEKPKASAKR